MDDDRKRVKVEVPVQEINSLIERKIDLSTPEGKLALRMLIAFNDSSGLTWHAWMAPILAVAEKVKPKPSLEIELNIQNRSISVHYKFRSERQIRSVGELEKYLRARELL